ncbi:MAG: tyrosine-type recombinase/integrase [Clostridia bacterium]|nr:tyrosine-type recombinase/integrase [Clostridia bacterium]
MLTDAREHSEQASLHAKLAIKEAQLAKQHADIAGKEAEQGKNCAEVFDSYLAGKLDKQENESINNQIVEMPISLDNIQGEIDLMKNISKRKDGRYMGRKQIRGEKILVYAYTLKECARLLNKAIKELLTNHKVKKEKYRLHAWMDNWFITYKEPFVKYRSAQNIKNIVNEIKSNFENVYLHEITTNALQRYLNTYKISRKKEFIELYFNASLQKAEDISLIAKNPFKAVVKAKRIKNVRKPFNLIEQTKIMKALQGNLIQPVILFYLLTGVRKNELKTFDIENDIDATNCTIRILSEKKRTDNNYRLIDVTPGLIEIVKQNNEVFKLKTDYIYRKFKDILDKLHITGGIHTLRHTFATNHYYLGTPAKQVQEWLGHETIDITQNIYTHIDRTITKEDIIKLYNNLYYKI